MNANPVKQPIPERLSKLLAEFDMLDEVDLRADLLIEFATRFNEVPEQIAKRPFPKSALVPGCQSEAYAWSVPLDNHTLKFYFAVENPQGISAMAMAVILDDTLSGSPLDQIINIDSDIVYQIFGKGISMGKGQGLMGMLFMVQALAKERRYFLSKS